MAGGIMGGKGLKLIVVLVIFRRNGSAKREKSKSRAVILSNSIGWIFELA